MTVGHRQPPKRPVRRQSGGICCCRVNAAGRGTPRPRGRRTCRGRPLRSLDAAAARLMRLHAIACDVLARPVYLCAARSPHVVDITPARVAACTTSRRTCAPSSRRRSTAPAPATTRSCSATGCAAGRRPGSRPVTSRVVLPRAHDCITLFLGARERYAAETQDRPATYWYVADQLERGDGYRDAGLGYVAIGGDTDDDMEADPRRVRRQVRRGQRGLPDGGHGCLAVPLRPGRLRLDGRRRRGASEADRPRAGGAPGLGLRARGGQPGPACGA